MPEKGEPTLSDVVDKQELVNLSHRLARAWPALKRLGEQLEKWPVPPDALDAAPYPPPKLRGDDSKHDQELVANSLVIALFTLLDAPNFVAAAQDLASEIIDAQAALKAVQDGTLEAPPTQEHQH